MIINQRVGVLLGIVLAALLLAFPWIVRNNYLIRVAIIMGIYIILASSLNIVNGFSGMFSIGHGAFYGIGAYAAALLALQAGLPFWATLPAAGLTASLFGAFLGVATLRLRKIFLAFATLGFAEITRIVILNWVALTRGPMGITGIPVPVLFGKPFKGYIQFYYLIGGLAALSLFLIHRLYRSRIGRAFVAIREDELAAESMGVNVFGYKVLAFSVACFFAGLCGAFYAHFARFISADQFGINESFAILTMVAFGGTGSLLGPIIGAIMLVGIPEVFRFLVEYRMVLYGLILIGVMVLKPEGLAGVKGIFSRPVGFAKGRSKTAGEAS